MLSARTYLDWNASAQVYPEVVELMSQVLLEGGNASSVHHEGRRAHNRIELAREQVANLVNATSRNVIFTSGGSEANALALSGLAQNGSVNRVLVSSIEHPSLLASAVLDGAELTHLPVDHNGVIILEALEEELLKASSLNEKVLISVMWANNETGVIQPIEKIVELAHSNAAMLHCDAIQAAGKVAIDFVGLGIDLMSLSAHKIGGPQGVGALIVKSNLPLTPMIKGGGQELNRRAGTENLSGIAGFGLAAQLSLAALKDMNQSNLRDSMEAKLKSIRGDVIIFGEECDRLPNTACIAVSDTNAETLLIAFDLAGIAVSSGSACSSGKVAKSHVLSAMGIDEALAKAAIRVSMGRTTTDADIEKFTEIWAKAVNTAAQQKNTVAA